MNGTTLTGTIDDGYGPLQLRSGKRLVTGFNCRINTLDGRAHGRLAHTIAHTANLRLPGSFDC